MFPERSFDESPDEKRYEEDEAQGFDAFFRFEEDRVNHGRVLEESKVLLHPVLLFVEGENLSGIGGAFSFFGSVTNRGLARLYGDASPPLILQQPFSQTNWVGAPAALSVNWGGTPTPSFEWRRGLSITHNLSSIHFNINVVQQRLM